MADLNRRKTGYQFDLERDIAWARADEPGLYMPPELVRDAGVDISQLAAHPPAWELFQWASAVSICEGFIIAEQAILHFMDENEALLTQKSNDLLYQEESKHIELFQRTAELLRNQHPKWVADFDRHFEATGTGSQGFDFLELIEDSAVRHLCFWMAVTYFEEQTVYLHKRLSGSPEVKLFWKSAHHAHMKEEVQHIETDMAHVHAIRLPDAGRNEASQALHAAILRDFDRTYYFRVGVPMAGEAYPELDPIAVAPPERTAVYRDIVERSPLFRRTRENLKG